MLLILGSVASLILARARSAYISACDMKRICLVEHHRELNQHLCDTLARAGCPVAAFYEAAAALDHIAVEQPDLVILELFLPEGEGIQTLLTIREALPNVPVLIVVGQPHLLSACSIALALRLGADAALQAPFSDDELMDALTQVEHQNPPQPALC
jgi:two-component system response regulator CssR